MRRGLNLLLTVVFLGTDVAAAEDVTRAWSFKNNFSIPDAPAYLLLGVEPSDILRPETPRDLALGFAKFRTGDGGFGIPRAIALEFSPLLLSSPDDLTLAQYKKRRLWYASRLSVATLLDSTTGTPSRLAGGFRVTVVDERTIGTDSSYIESLRVTDLTRQILQIRTSAADRFREEAFRAIDVEAEAGGLSAAAVRERKREWIRKYGGDNPAQTIEEDEQIARLSKEIKKRFTERYWNATVLDLAAGVRATSPDSTGRSMRLDALSLWGTYALRTGRISQVILGLKGGSQRDSLDGDMRANLAVGARYYIGSARGKAFAEWQTTVSEEQRARCTLTGGIEFAASEWAWLNFGVASTKTTGEASQVVTTFRLKTALPSF